MKKSILCLTNLFIKILLLTERGLLKNHHLFEKY